MTTKKLRRNYYIKNSIAFTFALVLLLGSIINSYIHYNLDKKALYGHVDKTLSNAVQSTKLLLGESFFQQATTKNSISEQKDYKNTLMLSEYTNDNNNEIEYVYTMIQNQNNIYFTSSSATQAELQSKEITQYYDKYAQSTDALNNIFTNKRTIYEEATDKWGAFRSVLIPFTTKSGDNYIVGADIKIDNIKASLHQTLRDIIFSQLMVLIILIITAFFFIKISKKEIHDIVVLQKKLNEEIDTKTEALQRLNLSLEQRIHEEVEKNRKQDKLMVEQSRLAQMGEMLSMIAHQWRQPLTAISATSANINIQAQLDSLENETAIELSEQISEFSEHLSSTINDFRDFFKTNKEQADTTFTYIIDSVLNIVSSAMKSKNIELVTKLNYDEMFHSYPNELKQVVMNLIKNAEDVLLEKGIKNPMIMITTTKVSDGILLEVTDNGGGIENSIIDKIFDPYFSTKLEKHGTGLGLYMSKTIIEEHCEGTLSVSNVDNETTAQ